MSTLSQLALWAARATYTRENKSLCETHFSPAWALAGKLGVLICQLSLRKAAPAGVVSLGLLGRPALAVRQACERWDSYGTRDFLNTQAHRLPQTKYLNKLPRFLAYKGKANKAAHLFYGDSDCQ